MCLGIIMYNLLELSETAVSKNRLNGKKKGNFSKIKLLSAFFSQCSLPRTEKNRDMDSHGTDV